MRHALLHKATLCRNDWLPSGAGAFVAFTVALVLLFKACGYALAPDPSAIWSSPDWTYHALWLPLHLMLARCAAGNFARHASAAQPGVAEALVAELDRRVAVVGSARGLCVGLLLVAPFIVMDYRAGLEFIDAHAADQGRAAAFIPLIWLIEWLATAQIWLYVLGSLYITPLASHPDGLRGRLVSVLVHGQGRESIRAGLENAAVVMLYGISTVGYVWYADGQISDYLVLGVSTLMVLACFFVALNTLKWNLRICLDWREADIVGSVGEPVPGGAAVPFHFLIDSTDGLYTKPLTRDAFADARIRLLKLAALLPLAGKDDAIARPLADELRLLVECEVRLAGLGLGEMRHMMWRTGMPIVAIAAKPIAGLFGMH